MCVQLIITKIQREKGAMWYDEKSQNTLCTTKLTKVEILNVNLGILKHRISFSFDGLNR